MTKFRIENESQEVIVRLLQADAKKLDIPFEISQDRKSFQTNVECLDYLQKQLTLKMITEDNND